MSRQGKGLTNLKFLLCDVCALDIHSRETSGLPGSTAMALIFLDKCKVVGSKVEDGVGKCSNHPQLATSPPIY